LLSPTGPPNWHPSCYQPTDALTYADQTVGPWGLSHDHQRPNRRRDHPARPRLPQRAGTHRSRCLPAGRRRPGRPPPIRPARSPLPTRQVLPTHPLLDLPLPGWPGPSVNAIIKAPNDCTPARRPEIGLVLKPKSNRTSFARRAQRRAMPAAARNKNRSQL